MKKNYNNSRWLLLVIMQCINHGMINLFFLFFFLGCITQDHVWATKEANGLANNWRGKLDDSVESCVGCWRLTIQGIAIWSFQVQSTARWHESTTHGVSDTTKKMEDILLAFSAKRRREIVAILPQSSSENMERKYGSCVCLCVWWWWWCI